jgi:bacterioferritin
LVFAPNITVNPLDAEWLKKLAGPASFFRPGTPKRAVLHSRHIPRFRKALEASRGCCNSYAKQRLPPQLDVEWPLIDPRRAPMKGKAEVISVLQDMLREELTAINQYILHAEMQENWGYKKLSAFIKKQSIGEMKHAEALIERILFLEGMPNLSELDKLNIGKDVAGQLRNDLELERGAVGDYNKAIELCRKHSDNAPADFLTFILKDEEAHVDFLETQLDLIKKLGTETYLAQQMGDLESK